ncbi:MOSC domain-containing protein [Ferribacterium limneticum]|uniref:MOSC domain-containing protein n=1 Tax=Ferribacterium limneticum TaxID=76259 RepID=UPI001CFABCBC|nr:MOSC domain-containing protein [Ferribacterium limneticum]UCV19070.1 MOSC domain-containing protein [Ferribacterium limneticum]
MVVERLFLSPARGETQRECRQLELLAGQGVLGDRHFAKESWAGQQLTLVEAEEIERFCAHTGRPDDLSLTRRNVVTRGIRLNQLVGRQFRLGACLLVGVETCEPCRTLGRRLANETLSAPEVVKYWLGRGGLRANVLISGHVACGDTLTLIEAGEGAP